MKIVVNGEKQDIDHGISLSAFIRTKDVDPSRIVVEHNSVIIPYDDFEHVTLSENDRLEIVSFVGGG